MLGFCQVVVMLLEVEEIGMTHCHRLDALVSSHQASRRTPVISSFKPRRSEGYC